MNDAYISLRDLSYEDIDTGITKVGAVPSVLDTDALFAAKLDWLTSNWPSIQ